MRSKISIEVSGGFKFPEPFKYLIKNLFNRHEEKTF